MKRRGNKAQREGLAKCCDAVAITVAGAMVLGDIVSQKLTITKIFALAAIFMALIIFAWRLRKDGEDDGQ